MIGGRGRERWVLAGICLVFVFEMALLWGYLTDDTYIHLVYAKNLLLGRGWVFNLGEPSYGSTSPFWVLLLAPFAGSESSGLLAARLLGCLAGLASILVFYRLAGVAISRPWLRLAATLVFATEVWFVRWSASGMESSLAVLLLLLVFYGLSASHLRSGPIFGVGLLAGLASLVRPEFYLFALLLLVLALLSRRWRRHFWMLAAGLALPLVPWLLFAQLELGGAFPTTAAAKSRGWQGIVHLLVQSGRLLKIPLSSQALLLGINALGVLFCLSGAACRRETRAGLSRTRFRFYALLAVLWGLALPAVFVLRDVQVISRYLLPVTPLLPLGAFYFLDLWGDRWPRLLRFVPLVVLLTLLPNFYLLATQVVPHARRFPVELEGSLGEIANYLNHHGAPGSRVAAPDIGLLGFRSGCRIVDLGGLIHPEIAEYWHAHGYRKMMGSLSFLSLREADYLVDRDARPASLAGAVREGKVLVPIMSSPVSGLGLRNPEPVHYTLYWISPTRPETGNSP